MHDELRKKLYGIILISFLIGLAGFVIPIFLPKVEAVQTIVDPRYTIFNNALELLGILGLTFMGFGIGGLSAFAILATKKET